MLCLGLLVALASALVLVCCSSDDGRTERPASTSEPSAGEQATPDPATGADTDARSETGQVQEAPTAETVERLGRLPGRLAVGRADQLAVVDPDGTDLVWLDDAADVLAAQPVWSADGRRLAWSRTSAVGHELVVADIGSGEQVASPLPGSAAFYLQWSAGGEALAYLRNDAAGRGIEFGYAVPGTDATPLIASAPFYVAWAPTGSSLAAHVANAQVIVLEDLLDVAPGRAGEPRVVLDPAGGFTTPAWLDESTLLVNSPAGLSLLDINSQRAATIVASPASVKFVVSPDRSKVAYLVPGLDSGVSRVALAQADPLGGLVVLDFATGESTTVTAEVPLAWQWSPDSEQLAWLEGGVSAVRPQSRWHFWDGANTTSAEPYRISSRDLQSVLPFFEQYAESHSRWSPDSTAFAFAGSPASVGDDGGDAVWVHLVGSDDPPVRLADGDLVIWSN